MNSSLRLTATFSAVLFLGTPATTQIELVKDLVPGRSSGNPLAMAVLNDSLYFLARPTGSLELWRCDYDSKTDEYGVQAIKLDLPAGQPSQFVWLVDRRGKERLCFTISIAGGSQLWRTDGTPSGTVLEHSAVVHEQLTAVGDQVYFTERFGQALWNVFLWNGTAFQFSTVDAGQYKLYRSPTVSDLTSFRGDLLFVANLESTKGQVTRDMVSGSMTLDGGLDRWPEGLTVFKDQVFFSAYRDHEPDPTHAGGVFPRSRELWVTDGNQKYELFMDFTPNNALNPRGSSPRWFTVVGDRMFFWADVPYLGDDGVTFGVRMELFVTDGTRPGTKSVGNVIPEGSIPAETGSRVGDMFLFSMRTPGEGNEYWVSDGTEKGTRLLSDIHPTGSSQPHSPLPVGSRHTWFVAHDGVHGNELWWTDGVLSAMKEDLYPVTASSSPEHLTYYKGRIYFSARTRQTGRELFSIEAGAISNPVGRGYDAEGSPPTLRSDDPVLGSRMEVACGGLPTDSIVGLFFGHPGAPLAIVQGGVTRFDPTRDIVLGGVKPLGQSELALGIPIPADPSLKGKRFMAQVGGLTKDGKVLLSNPLELILGF